MYESVRTRKPLPRVHNRLFLIYKLYHFVQLHVVYHKENETVSISLP